VARACQVCDLPSPEGADVILSLFGSDLSKGFQAIAKTPTGEGLLNRLRLPDDTVGEARQTALDEITARRQAALEVMNAETAEAIATPEKMADYLADCINCYNCRVACPVCYCKECVFVTDVFDHEPWQYQGWARKRGALRVPVDTLFYHLTRLAHSSLSCVGCGQCSNACPNDIPVMEIFRLVGGKTQAAFDYVAGRNPDEPTPLSVFQEKELLEVTGGVG
jgi:formate dehydrogenase subunit beta